jgi:hypothetical protein
MDSAEAVAYLFILLVLLVFVILFVRWLVPRLTPDWRLKLPPQDAALPNK